MVQIPAELPAAALPPKILARKREILAGASRVFRRQGLHATGMRDVAAELAMTAGNLYYYFENKEALLAFCQEDALAGLLRLARRCAGNERPPAQALALLLVGHVVRLNEGTPGSLAHFEVEALGEPLRGGILARRNAYELALRRLIARGVEAGAFRPEVEPRLAALALLGAVNWTVKWFAAGRGKSAREIGLAFTDQLVRGLLAPHASFRLPTPAEIDDVLRENEDAN